MIDGRKVVGSAQRKQRGAMMQHGGVLLAQSPFTPSLPGIRELAGVEVTADALGAAILARLRDRLGWTLKPGNRTAEDERAASELARNRYADPAWNRRR
jgi:lipoate-protein ligase A